MKSLIQIFSSARMTSVLLLGFSSGLPLSLIAGGSTMQAWMKDSKLDLQTISRFALIGLPYALKFLWAPFLDTYNPPFLGRRRGWALITQLGLLISLAMLAFADPATGITQFALLALLVAFFSASQDIVLDALRTEMLTSEELGPGGSIYLVGYRLALLVSGAVALALSAKIAWKTVYLLMASFMVVGMIATLWVQEPNVPIKKVVCFKDRILVPFADFFKRTGAMEILAFVMLYKLPTLMATALTTVFLMEMGFEKIEIATVSKVAGLIATLVGTLAGGALMVKLGVRISLWIFGIFQAMGGGLFILVVILGKNYFAMTGVIIADNFLMGMGTAAIVGFMMSVCSLQFTGTQYALLSSLTAFTRVVFIAPAGTIAQEMGWIGYFIFSMLLALPGLLLLTRFGRWIRTDQGEQRARLSRLDLFVMATFLLSLIIISTDFVWSHFGIKNVGLWVGGSGVLLSGIIWILKAWLRVF